MDAITDPAALAAEPAPARQRVKTINLALQGGGAHGAFGWGVLDRLLADERIALEGLSATSAGAMNAVVLAFGLGEGGRDAARAALAAFWRAVARVGASGPLQPSWWDRVTHNHHLDASPAFAGFDLLTRILSPYQLNPTNWNPLRRILERSVDFDRLRERAPVELFLSATNVRTGKIRVFRRHEITADAVMASACLPFLFHGVEIDGETYWDGGYMGNPALFPLVYHCAAPDIVVVHVNPLERPAPPRTAAEIMNRVNEISFNSSLMREMRAIGFVTRLIDDGRVCDGSLKRVLVHAIAGDEVMRGLSVMSKLNADGEFLEHLHDEGWDHADRWLTDTFDRLGHVSSVDIQERYL